MRFIQLVLRGIGQVMFQNNIYSGILFLIGVFYNYWLLGLATLLGTITSTYTAQFLKYPKEDIENGLYGFNGALTGIAVLCFFEISLSAVVALIIASFLSSLLMNLLSKFTQPFTAPFVLITWVVLFLFITVFNFPFAISSESTASTVNILIASSNSFGQVMFQENVITGLCFLVGILINDKLLAMIAMYAAVVGSLTGWIFSDSVSTVNAGLMGYNAILCAIALTGKKWTDFLWITFAIILSTLLNIGLSMTDIITLTIPFVITTWGVLKFKKTTYLKTHLDQR